MYKSVALNLFKGVGHRKLMKEYRREYPYFSLCGLSCGLCPRYHTDGKSKCPGCGGNDFHLKHPTCAIITCNKKHDNVEFCFQCSSYPCERYKEVSEKDSFITYKNVLKDITNIKNIGLEKFKEMLNTKIKILEKLLKNYNDGRKKNFYCIAVNLLPIKDLNEIMENIENEVKVSKFSEKEKISYIISMFETYAKKKKLIFKWRK